MTNKEKINLILINELTALAFYLYMDKDMEKTAAIDKACIAFEVFCPFIYDQISWRANSWNKHS